MHFPFFVATSELQLNGMSPIPHDILKLLFQIRENQNNLIKNKFSPLAPRCL